MRKWREFRRVMALALALVLTLGLLPVMHTPAAAAGTTDLTVSGKVADPETLHNWQQYYGDSSLLPNGSTGISTWKAGGVWTDKSVFASDADIQAAGLPATLEDPNAFLVSLSALASNKEIVGQSSAPTDTMLVLDVSGSMDDNDKAEGMVEAANRAIHGLLQQNKNNRVGVMLYSGTRNDDGATATTLLLPLDHYTTTSTVSVGSVSSPENIPAYLTISDENEKPDVGIASGVRDSDKLSPSSVEREVVGATYIQRGLYDAWKEFQKVTDTKVPEGNTQAGVQRSPVIILMSDGRPTLATEEYNKVGLRDSEHGNGSESTTTDKTVFLTQLTAAWVKGAISDHYGTDAKLYTLGLGTGNDTYATNVLSPSGTTNSDILTWWTNFQENAELNDGTVEVQEEIQGSGRPGRPGYVEGQDGWYLDYDNDRFATGVGRNYTDRYWSASNVDSLIDAFKQIVDEIGLQSAYSATLVQSGEADLDGYVTVEDELGSMMVVKDIKGLLLNGVCYDGSNMAAMLQQMGTYTDPTEYGNLFVRTVKERLGITDTSVAQQLIGDAYAAGQISYTSDTQYSNYIGWYGGENNEYLGFWQESYGYDMTNAPAGAKYINKSYGYVGAASTATDAADMMHIIVMVHTEIATGHQTVLFKVPSSLIPMVTYKVDLEGDSLETATDVTLTVTENEPIRLLYEVGLPDDVTALNLQQKIAEYLAKDGSNHIHQNADGSYTFYANSWGAVHDVAPDISELTDAEKQTLTASVPESHFIPNTANERFYVLEDSVVYDSAHNVLTSLPAAGGEYYFARTIVNVTGANGQAQAVTQYEKLSAATVANSNNFEIVNGQCIVKAGTVRQTLSDLELAKSENTTGTIGYSDSLWVYVPGTDAEDYNVYSFLGNNGKLTVTPATGIAVTKDLIEVAENASANEKFEIVVTLDAEVAAPVVTDADGNLRTDYACEISGGKTQVSFGLTDGEIFYITGLPANVSYTVEEVNNKKYQASYTYEDPDKTTDAGVISGVIVSNEPIKPGNLYITKEVVHAVAGETFPSDAEFDFEVKFVDVDGRAMANTTFQLENNYDATLTELTTDENGVMTGKLRHGETSYIKGIPAGTVVTVTEVNVPENYKSTTSPKYVSHNQSGEAFDNDGTVTIISEANAQVVVTNTYTPKATSVSLNIAGTKIFHVNGNLDAQHAGSFTFLVEQWNGSQWVAVANKTATLDYAEGEGSSTKYFTIANVLEGVTFDKAGVYTYQVREQIGSVSNVTYDRTLWTFTVTVTDVNGQLVATVTDVNNNKIEDGSYEVSFTNEFHTAPVSIDIVKEVDNKSGSPDISKAGFQFVAVQTDESWQPLTGDAASSLELYSDGAGEARMTATYKTAGSYYYIVTETNDGKSGWTYDATQYKIKVEVTKDEATGDLTANMTVTKIDKDGNETAGETAGDSASITFKNTYDPTDATVPVGVEALVKKELAGRALNAGEFTFAIFEDGQVAYDANGVVDLTHAIAVATNDAAGNVYFDNDSTDGTEGRLTFSKVGTYHYDIVEVKGDKGGVSYDSTVYDLVIEVTDNGDGTLKAVYYFEDAVGTTVTFKNTYTAAPAEVTINGLKTVTVNSGVYVLNAGDFTFGLYENDQKIAETQNLANGTFSFEKIVYDTVGTYTYVIKEIAPDGSTDGSYKANGMDYSDQVFAVTVKITDNEQGQLVAEVTGNGVELVKFVNTYDSIPASVYLPATKELNGRALTEGEFKFAIYRSDETFTTYSLVTDTVTHDADGKLAFSVGGLGLGYHYFIFKEVIPEDRATGIHYDAGEYHITVQVTDSGRGQMSAVTTVYHPGDPNNTNPSIAFSNTYRPEDGQYILSGTKVLEGGKPLAAGDFTIGLFENDTEKLAEASVAADGTFAFEAITYTADDIGSHAYTIQELIPDGATENHDGSWTLGNITYDPTIYTVIVYVSDDDQDGKLEFRHTVFDSEKQDYVSDMVFTNTHTPDPITHVLEATKIYEKGLKGDDFEFRLVSADDKTDVDQTKTNDAEGKIVFDAITFTAAGAYKFTVKEKTDSIWNFIRPSAAEYEVTVNVVNENGVLRVSTVNVVNTKNTGEGNLQFVNTYLLEGQDDVILNGTKTVTGDSTTVPAGEFAFGLYNDKGDLVESVKNDTEGKFTFSALIFDQDDVEMNGQSQFVYTVKEIAGDNARYTYDETVYTVTVTVKDNDQGGVDASYVVTKAGAAVESIGFTNTYTNPTPVTYTPVAQKSYNKELTGGEFTFTLEGEGYEKQEKTNDATGKVTFDTLSFPEAGTYTFTVKEVGKILGFINYSKAEHTIIVTVIDTKGVLSIQSVTINGDEDGTVEFVNVYKFDGEGEVTLRGTKTVTGDRTTVNAGEFEFGLYDSQGNLVESVKNDATGAFAFTTLTFDETHTDIDGEKTYTYTVKEIPGAADVGITYDKTVYTVTVTVKDNDRGGIDVSHTITKDGQAANIAFTNTYTVTGTGKLELSGSKALTGGKPLADGDFTFGLYEAGQLVTSAKNVGSAFTLTKEYTAEDIGSYTYTVQEVIPAGAVQNKDGTWTLGTVTYDSAAYTVEVTVSDNGVGGITVTHEVKDASAITFTNTHTPVAVPFSLEATKIYNKPLTGGEFTFILTGKGFDKQEKTNDATGKVVFDTLQLTEAGTYTFTVKEKEVLLGFIKWDKSEYTVTVTVENQAGVLVITDQTVTVGSEAKDGGVVFQNEYVLLDDEDTVELTVSKTMSGDRTDPAGFVFGLYDAQGKLVDTVTSDADGVVSFAPITYTDAHIGTHTYTVKEILPTDDAGQPVSKLGGVTYDTTVYTVVVTVIDNGQGYVEASYTVDGKAVDEDAYQFAFANSYDVTGTAEVTLEGTKSYSGRDLQGGDFTFVLTESGKELERVTNAADGTFVFEAITYTAEDIGTHTYTISELLPADAVKNAEGLYVKDGITYDPAVYTVEITVADDGQGGLSVTKKVNNQAVTDVNVSFDNHYQIVGTGKLELTGAKTLTGGKTLEDGAFSFGLYEDGHLVAKVANVGGTFVITKEYTAKELGTYTYTVSEILPAGAMKVDSGSWTLDGVAYDPTVYTVKVTVSDNGKGGIDVAHTLVDASTIAFENVYTPDPAVVTVNVQKVLDNKTDKAVSLAGFEFVIALGDNTYTAKSDENGKTGFTVTFDESDIGKTYTFYVSEKNTGIKGMTYDKTVHTVTVQVLQNADGSLITKVNGHVSEAAEVGFTNTYEELVTPPTGDNFNLLLPIALMLLSALGVVAVIALRKKKAA